MRPNFTFCLDSIGDLRKTTPTNSTTIIVLGHYSPGDGGGGVFRGSEGLSGAFVEDGATTILGLNGDSSRAWVRLVPFNRSPFAPRLYDAMSFIGKPNLGLSTDIGLIYEWEATIQYDPEIPASARTIEEPEYRAAIARYSQHKMLIVGIESLPDTDDPIAIEYLRIAKDVRGRGKSVTWWNLAPKESIIDPTARFANFITRLELIGHCDFCTLASYFVDTDTIVKWRDRNAPRYNEARRLYEKKPLIAVLSPHLFLAGRPWPFLSYDIMSRTLDIVASLSPDGILLWSFEGTGQIQTWDENWPWVAALRERTSSDGHYTRPG